MRICAQIGLELIKQSETPKLNVLIFRDGAHLDDRNLKALHDIAVKYDALVIVERVVTDPKGKHGCDLIIEDGEVVEDRIVGKGKK